MNSRVLLDLSIYQVLAILQVRLHIALVVLAAGVTLNISDVNRIITDAVGSVEYDRNPIVIVSADHGKCSHYIFLYHSKSITT